MSLLNFNRKGQISSYMTVILVLFTTGFINIFAFMLHANFINAFTNAGIYSGAVAEAGAKFASALQLYDWVILIVMVALILTIGLTSFKLNAAPAFFIVTIFMAVFLGFVSYFFNFIFQEMVSQSIFATTILFFPRTLLICTNLHWVSLAALIVGSITLYAKKDSSQFVANEGKGAFR